MENTMANDCPSRAKLRHAKRLVVKLGSAVVLDQQGQFARSRIDNLMHDLFSVSNQNEIVLVCSGAVGAGMTKLGINHVKAQGSTRWACAAAGQASLWPEWHGILHEHGKVPAQILLTEADFSDRDRYLQISETITRLLHLDSLPVINENDTANGKTARRGAQVFDDNDRLAALVASAIDADALIILSNVDGVFDRPPEEESAKLLYRLENDRPLSFGLQSTWGRGGMKAKVAAAQFAAQSGVAVVIGNGTSPNALKRILDGQLEGTAIMGQKSHNKRRNWLAQATAPQGKVRINTGAYEALCTQTNSLLMRGVLIIEGDFEPGSVLELETENRQIVGRGVSRMSSSQARQAQITQQRSVTLIKRDDLVIFGEPS